SEIRARTQLEGERADPHCPHLAAVRISEAGIRAAVTIAAKPIAVAAEIPGYGCRRTDGVGADRRRVWTFGRAWKRLHSARPFVSLSLRGGGGVLGVWARVSPPSPSFPSRGREGHDPPP